MKAAANGQKIRSFLELVRIHLVPTALADPLTGAFLCSVTPPPSRLAAAAGAGALLYAAGMATNDLADRAKDRLRHPARPLPSGRIRPSEAWALSAALVAGALLLAAAAGSRTLWLAAGLLGSIALYNGAAKRMGVLGCLVMGACRALNLLLGASFVAGAALPFGPAGLLGSYVAAVTLASLGEDRPFRARAFALSRWGWLFFPALLAVRAGALGWGLLAAAPLALWLGVAFARTLGSPGRPAHPVEGFTRHALAGIFLLDAGLLAAAGRAPAAVGVAALWAFGSLLRRALPASGPPVAPIARPRIPRVRRT